MYEKSYKKNMINFNKTLQLFINGEEYDFSNKIRFNLHPTNFSSITLNDVIKKSNNKFPLNTFAVEIPREFYFAELKQDGETIFIGVINDIGRLSLFPNSLKTFSVKITDFRKWLSLAKPINKIYRNQTFEFIVNDLINSLNEPKIQVGILDFANENNATLNSYNTTNKTLYQILKNVIERQTNSLLYFTTENGKILINYKAIKNLKENISNIELNIRDENFLKKYKITDITYDNEVSDYYNFLSYTSDNVISKLPITEYDLPLNKEKILLKYNPAKIDVDINKTFLVRNGNKTNKIAPVILNSQKITNGKYWDLSYSTNNNTLEVRVPSNELTLTISYYKKDKLTLESQNPKEIKNIAKFSKTSGIVFKTEKFNDISSEDDLLAAVKNDINKYSTPRKTLNIESGEAIWDILENVKVSGISQNINGNYIVKEVEGESIISGDSVINSYRYTLSQTSNTNTILNKYDNQSYRDNPLLDDDFVSEFTETITSIFNLEFSIVKEDITKNVGHDAALQQELQTNLVGNIPIKFPLLKVGRND